MNVFQAQVLVGPHRGLFCLKSLIEIFFSCKFFQFNFYTMFSHANLNKISPPPIKLVFFFKWVLTRISMVTRIQWHLWPLSSFGS